MRVALAAALLVALAAASNAAAGVAPARATLTITYWPQGQPGPSRTWTLRCAPLGGTHPQRVTACRKLDFLTRSAFRPVPKDAVCTMVYGGPAQALVRGKFRGNRVWAQFRLRDGCEIERWNRLVPVLPAAGAA